MRHSPHPMTLRQLQYALAVAETRNFRRAAELCHVSQPSLSAQLAELESGLGARLFERDRRGVLPTAAGEALLTRARRLLVEADDLVEAARGFQDPMAGTVRLGVIPTVSPYLLPAVVPALTRAFERLVIEWVEDKTETLGQLLAAGSIDGALAAVDTRLGDVEQLVVGEDPFVLATALEHPLGKTEKPMRLDDLEGETVLLLDEGHCLRDQALAVCARAGTRERDFRATSLGTLVQMVSSGAGVTLLPALAVETETRRAALKTRPLKSPAPGRTIALVFRHGAAREQALRAVADVIKRAYPRPPRPRA